MSASKAERILPGLLSVNSDATNKIFLYCVSQVHIFPGELHFLLLGSYSYVVNCMSLQLVRK